MSEYQSEFGRGFAYCLGLFLAHAEREGTDEIRGIPVCLWFNGAADHLYELEVPPGYTAEESADIEDFKRKCLKWRLSPYTTEEKKWSIQKAKDLLRAYDAKNGVVTQKGGWE